MDRDVIGQLTGDVQAVATLDQKFGVRAEVEDPAAFEKTLDKVMAGLPEYADGVTITKPGRGERLYAVATADGQTYAVGVADGALVMANDPGLAGEVVGRGLVDSELDGAFVMEADAEEIWITEAVWRYPGVQAQLEAYSTETRTAEFHGIEQPMTVVRVSSRRHDAAA